ncbi:UDP-N-acetylmuramate dehydrogenase [soil metagenome]
MDLSELTTLHVGGPAFRLVSAATTEDLVRETLEVWQTGEDWLVLGGGSNIVVADDGFPGVVIRVLTHGIERLADESAGVIRLRAQAGESWDELVEYTVRHGFAGIEALSGIPGSSGAAPIQNIGAYGQEIGSSLVGIEFLDEESGEVEWLDAAELELGYRTSALKQGRRGVVLSIELRLTETIGGLSQPVQYPQLAKALGITLGETVPLTELRDAVIALRSSKGMILDSFDPDSVSAGSFFTNPIVSEEFARTLPTDAPRWPTTEVENAPVITPIDAVEGPFDPPLEPPFAPPFDLTPPVDRTVKLSAAWLIEHSGIRRGFRLPGSAAAVSSKHTLALINTGTATATEITELARYIQTRVLGEFGVILQPEPLLIGVQV